ncbi:hypothetical protein [Streptomyces griseoaurantiacus]|uniref:Uncharacterized protein n=1 Tax=Streptomyces griseoaurantiacus TaxID=68213 RepID=A0A7W2DSL2_9ACTN|nr:hypothetical protein [Streptomyces griseoaurantiacus]MBA5222228.1 hypothetical protein [Streptomyces griseoaurantiacus]
MTAVGFTSGDPRKVNDTGDTLTGGLTLSGGASNLTVGGSGTIAGPVVVGDGTTSSSITITSSYAGGQDDANGSDSTGRLELSSHQRAATQHLGEVIRIYSRKWDSKQMIAWKGPTEYTEYNAADDTGGDPVGDDETWFWMGAHYEANDHGSVHGHWSMETPDTNGQMQTRLEVKLWDPTADYAFGLDKTYWVTNQADWVVRCQDDPKWVLRLAGSAQNRDVQWARDVYGAEPRWALRTTNETESGSGAGSNFRLLRYADDGTQVDAPLSVSRATGRLTLGGTSGTAGGVAINRNTTNPAVTVNSLAAGGTAIAGIVPDTAGRVLQGEVSGDASRRFIVHGDGKIEWGDGAANVDVNLYRSSVDLLRTDDSFRVDGALGVGLTASGAKLSVSSSSAQVVGLFNTTVASSGNANPIVEAIGADAGNRAFGARVTGDAQRRYAVYTDGKTEWGDGTASRDVNLYRSAANVLKTDDKMIAALGLGVGNSASATTLGTVTKKMEVFDASGNSLGFVPIYSSIT